MSKEIVNKIVEAEARAQQIRVDAHEEAKARVRRAEEQGRLLCEVAATEAQYKNGEKLSIARTRAEELISKSRDEAVASVNATRELAEFNMREAVRAIVAGVDKQCR